MWALRGIKKIQSFSVACQDLSSSSHATIGHQSYFICISTLVIQNQDITKIVGTVLPRGPPWRTRDEPVGEEYGGDFKFVYDAQGAHKNE